MCIEEIGNGRLVKVVQFDGLRSRALTIEVQMRSENEEPSPAASVATLKLLPPQPEQTTTIT